MDFARTTLGKQARPAASASATSRKNKLQRCSVCGGLGHKSRTCDQALKTQDLSDCLDDRRRSDSPTLSSDSDDTPADALDVRAACCVSVLRAPCSCVLALSVSPSAAWRHLSSF